MTLSVVIAAGGTGGHLIPALAVADALRRMEPDARITFVGTGRGLDRELIPKAGYAVRRTSMKPFGSGAKGLAGAASTIPATAQALSILRETAAGVVLGMGGYASLPVIIGARLRRIPAVIHEANTVVGLANEVASRFTKNIAVSFEPTLRRFPAARVTGIPLRPAFESFDKPALRAEAMDVLSLRRDLPTVVVFGGSLGAARINAAAAALASRWREREDLQLIVIAGHAHAEQIRSIITPGKLPVRVEAFVDRMDLVLAAADLAVCRAGASTIGELAAAKVPSILVPLPHARRKEQHANAAVMTDAGAAEQIADADLDADSLGRAVEDLLADEGRRTQMAAAAGLVARPHAAAEIAEWVRRLGGGSS